MTTIQMTVLSNASLLALSTSQLASFPAGNAQVLTSTQVSGMTGGQLSALGLQ
jgi:hypothetical protein